MNDPRVFKLKNQEGSRKESFAKSWKKSCSIKKEMVMQLVAFSCSMAFNAWHTLGFYHKIFQS